MHEIPDLGCVDFQRARATTPPVRNRLRIPTARHNRERALLRDELVSVHRRRKLRHRRRETSSLCRMLNSGVFLGPGPGDLTPRSTRELILPLPIHLVQPHLSRSRIAAQADIGRDGRRDGPGGPWEALIKPCLLARPALGQSRSPRPARSAEPRSAISTRRPVPRTRESASTPAPD